jgi:hypothetical protein
VPAPADLSRPHTPADSRFAGLYLPQRRNFSTVEKIAGAFYSRRIALTDDGYLRLGNGLWVQRGKLAFEGASLETAGKDMRFIEDDRHNVEAMTIGTQYWTRAGMIDDYRLLAGMILGTVLFCLGTVWGFWRRRCAPRRLLQQLGHTGARHSGMLGLCIVLWTTSLLALLSCMLDVLRVTAGTSRAAFSYPPLSLELALMLGHAAAALVVIQTLLLFQVVRIPNWTGQRKLRHIGGVLWMFVTVALMVHWNLLGAPVQP